MKSQSQINSHQIGSPFPKTNKGNTGGGGPVLDDSFVLLAQATLDGIGTVVSFPINFINFSAYEISFVGVNFLTASSGIALRFNNSVSSAYDYHTAALRQTLSNYLYLRGENADKFFASGGIGGSPNNVSGYVKFQRRKPESNDISIISYLQCESGGISYTSWGGGMFTNPIPFDPVTSVQIFDIANAEYNTGFMRLIGRD